MDGQEANTSDAAPGEQRSAIELVDVSRRFGRTEVVRNLSFVIAPGTICGLLAPSGGGKTTTLRLITGVYPPSSGTVRVLGAAPHGFLPAQRRRLGYMPQHFVLYPELSVRRNLEFTAGIYGLPSAQREERIAALLAMVELEEAKNRRAGRLSGGMQRRLQLAATLLHDPDLLVIDEPTAGIDPILRARFWEHFRELRDQGRTLVISTQYVTEAEHCDQVVLLHDGQVVVSGTPEELRRRATGTAGVPDTFEEVFLRLVQADQASEGGKV
jgi:ABC-2 type transport system ATP-binding protein